MPPPTCWCCLCGVALETQAAMSGRLNKQQFLRQTRFLPDRHRSLWIGARERRSGTMTHLHRPPEVLLTMSTMQGLVTHAMTLQRGIGARLQGKAFCYHGCAGATLIDWSPPRPFHHV
jgi:hypothetical protein